MQKQAGNVCIRCGKQRVDNKTWTERTDKGLPSFHTSTVCPDPECQKIVEERFASEKERREVVENERAQRSIANKLARQSKNRQLVQSS